MRKEVLSEFRHIELKLFVRSLVLEDSDSLTVKQLAELSNLLLRESGGRAVTVSAAQFCCRGYFYTQGKNKVQCVTTVVCLYTDKLFEVKKNKCCLKKSAAVILVESSTWILKSPLSTTLS